MPVVGTVGEIWRYPVKSMGGERLEAGDFDARGLRGDRGFATRDEQAGEIRGAKKLPGLLQCSARYVEEPGGAALPPAEITLPDGRRTRSDAPEVSALLGELLGRPVTLWPLQPPEALDHYRRAAAEGVDFMTELREIFGRAADEPLPNFAGLPPELFELTSPLGTYFDAFPVHVLTTGTLRALRRANPRASIDVRRFRPNLLIETDGDATLSPETAWIGKQLRIGAVRVAIAGPCPRCVMPTLPQGELPKDPGVLRTIVREFDQSFGVYATVAAGGRIGVGDRVELVDA